MADIIEFVLIFSAITITALVLGVFVTSKYRAYRHAKRLKRHFSSKISPGPTDAMVGDPQGFNAAAVVDVAKVNQQRRRHKTR